MIAVHARGNEKIGIGNLSRSLELVRYLGRSYPVTGFFECDECLFTRFESPEILRCEDQEQALAGIRQRHCDTYISDLVCPEKSLSDRLRQLGVKTIAHFNELDAGFEPDILFVTDGFDYPVDAAGIKVFRGFEYYVVGAAVLEKRRQFFEPVQSLDRILICFGGSDPAFYSEHFAKCIGDDRKRYTMVLGPAMADSRKARIKSLQRENITCVDSPENMVKLLLSHDLLVTLGGATTYEAMCLGVPACAVRWSYLERNVRLFGEEGMVNDLGPLEQAYSRLIELDLETVNGVAENAFNIIDGSALANIERVIRNHC